MATVFKKDTKQLRKRTMYIVSRFRTLNAPSITTTLTSTSQIDSLTTRMTQFTRDVDVGSGTIHCRSGNIREVLIFANFSWRTNS